MQDKKKGKKKALGVISEAVARDDLPDYSTKDFLEESKREEEDKDGFRVIKKGPQFDEDEALFQNDVYIPPATQKKKENKSKEQKKCDDDELLAMFESMPTAE